MRSGSLLRWYTVLSTGETTPNAIHNGYVKSSSAIGPEWRCVVHMLLEIFPLFVATVLYVPGGMRRHRQAERTDDDQQNQFFHMRRPSHCRNQEAAFGAPRRDRPKRLLRMVYSKRQRFANRCRRTT